jgi:hypothetical protein
MRPTRADWTEAGWHAIAPVDRPPVEAGRTLARAPRSDTLRGSPPVSRRLIFPAREDRHSLLCPRSSRRP